MYSGIDFFKSITFNGSNTNGNHSFTSQIETRIDHIRDGKTWHLNQFLQRELIPLLRDPEIRFLFYNPAQSIFLGNGISERTLCLNKAELLHFFSDKANMRTFAQELIPVVPFVHFMGHVFPEVHFSINSGKKYILQNVHSSSGVGTHCLSLEDCRNYVENGSTAESYLLSPFLHHAAPINVHVVIFERSCLVLPPSFQLIYHNHQNFSYFGGDFHTGLSPKSYHMILSRTQKLAKELCEIGYRGVCGVDYLLTDEELYFLEINPRFQASSFLLNKLLQQEGKLSLQQLNLMAFCGEEAPFESFMRFEAPESFFTITGEKLPKWFESPNLPAVVSSVIPDGLRPEMKRMPYAYLCRVLSASNLCWLNQDFQLQLAPNIHSDPNSWRKKILSMDPLTLKIGLLNQGIRFTENALRQMEQKGRARAGVFQSVDLILENGLIVNAPYQTKFSEMTPYYVEWDGEAFHLSYEDTRLCRVHFDTEDPHRDRIASNGTVFRNVAFWATDRLRVHHQLRCQFKGEGNGCHFCNVRPKEGNFSLEDVFEIVDFYLQHTDFRHFLIGGGSGKDTDEYRNILAIVRHIRTRSQKPIYIMCLPPKDPSVLLEYYKAGVNEIGFNLELFDRQLAQEIMPGKGRIPLTQYEAAYREAVKLWGQNGAVRSLMVLGLEPMEKFYQGVEWLCGLGVMPIISVFRPVKNIKLQDVMPPENESLTQIFYRASQIANRYNLSLGPSCRSCQNNTLSLPDFLR